MKSGSGENLLWEGAEMRPFPAPSDPRLSSTATAKPRTLPGGRRSFRPSSKAAPCGRASSGSSGCFRLESYSVLRRAEKGKACVPTTSAFRAAQRANTGAGPRGRTCLCAASLGRAWSGAAAWPSVLTGTHGRTHQQQPHGKPSRQSSWLDAGCACVQQGSHEAGALCSAATRPGAPPRRRQRSGWLKLLQTEKHRQFKPVPTCGLHLAQESLLCDVA